MNAAACWWRRRAPSAKHRALHRLIRQLPAAVMLTAGSRQAAEAPVERSRHRLPPTSSLSGGHLISFFSLNWPDTHRDGDTGCGFTAGEVLWKRCCLGGGGIDFRDGSTFALKGPAGNETNAIEKSDTAETCHRHNIADLAVAFEMRGGGVCDDIMDILLLGDHTTVSISPQAGNRTKFELSNKFLVCVLLVFLLTF